MTSPSPGLVLGGRYRLEAPLGRGGMGSVWRATHLALGTDVAVKLVDPSLADDATALARFRREAQAAAQLKSDNVVGILDFGVDAGVPYLVMERLEGETLRARLMRGPIAPTALATIANELARGLARAHGAGIVHRDLKPDNVFIATIDDREVVKILDFGIAKIASPLGAVDPLTRTGAALGTPHCMSPEQIEGRRDIDHRSDLWSMAVVIFECLCGRMAFGAETIGELVLQICVKPMPVPSKVARVPPGFDAWFARAADRVPSQRFESAIEAAAALGQTLTLAPFAATQQVTPSAAGPTFRGGDDQAGYVLVLDPSRTRIHLRIWGFWSVALAERYRDAWNDARSALQGRKWRLLADARKSVSQRAEVQSILIEVRRVTSPFMERAASVEESPTWRMQSGRLAQAASTELVLRFFDTVAEAEAYLDEP